MPTKRGRPAKWYTAPDGTVYEGLSHRSNGRWHIRGVGVHGGTAGLYLSRDTTPERAVEIFLNVKAGIQLPKKSKRYSQTEVNVIVADALAAARKDNELVYLRSKEFWAELRTQLIMNPWHVEKVSGIEGIGHFIAKWVHRDR